MWETDIRKSMKIQPHPADKCRENLMCWIFVKGRLCFYTTSLRRRVGLMQLMVRLQCLQSPMAGTLPGCKALLWPTYQPCLPCSRWQSALTICVLHKWPQMWREVTVQSCTQIYWSLLPESMQQEIITASLSALEWDIQGCWLHSVQPCLIFLPSLKWVLHKYSWPGKIFERLIMLLDPWWTWIIACLHSW